MSAMIGVALAASLIAAPPPVRPPEALEAVTKILAQDRYYFCREDNEFESLPDELRWCQLAANANYRGCPGFEQVCARSTTEPAATPLGIEDGSGKGRTSRSRARARARQSAESGQAREPDPPKQTADLSGSAKLLMWVLLFGLVLGVIYALRKHAVRDPEDERELEPNPDASESLVAARVAAQREVETDVQRLLARAEDAARLDRHEDAINNLYAALLRRLEGDELVSVERWKTNGDYLRALRTNTSLRAEVRGILDQVEGVHFGALEAGAERYHDIRTGVLAILGRVSLVLALALGLGGPLACDDSGAGDTEGLAGLGVGPNGQRGLAELLRTFDIDAHHRIEPLERLGRVDGAIVLLEGASLTDEQWEQLLAWVEDGGVLILADGSASLDRVGAHAGPQAQAHALARFQPDPLGWPIDLAAPPGRVIGLNDDVSGDFSVMVGRPIGESFGYWASPVGDFDTVVDTQADEPQLIPYVVLRGLGDGQLVAFAEPDMFSNAGLTIEANAAFLVNLFRALEVSEVEFVNAYTGIGSSNPMQSMRDAKLGALFLQVLLLLTVLYAAVGLPFTRLRAPSRERRRAFVEHVQMLGQRYAQAKAARYVAARYSAWALDRLRDRLQLGSARGLHSLAMTIAARTGRDQTEITRILVEAHSLRDAHAEPGRGGADELELMRALTRLLDQTGVH